ncbi:DUF2061 domain-containing protein [Alphaproteobacteria bacterium]|jgi:uncharacterized membrane protein|nr:DUF2061 domain-containing protein [Alphaproteobacteria bacterium]|tara:strand:- start:409 stop:846 length:438 start_codon:yes stop_codon:yes gene_type:complete
MIITKKRSLIKSLTWRLLGSIDTFILSLIIINYSSEKYSYDLALYIASFEIITKTILYYFHERIWNIFKIGRLKEKVKRGRSLFKAMTWRIIASLDTFFLSYIITGRFDWATSIAIFEIITKAIIYYFHERAWNRVKWGRVIENE